MSEQTTESTDASPITLSEWIKREGRKQTEIAKELGISDATLSRIANNLQKPGGPLANKIHQLTSGQVPFSSWFEAAE